MKTEAEQNKIIETALYRYGISAQLNMVIEECAELIQAINKVRRAKLITFEVTKPYKGMSNDSVIKYNNLCSEFADVKIMMKQLELMLDDETVKICYDRKIDRLETRLNK